MVERVIVLNRVHERQPDIDPEDVCAAWDDVLICRPRVDTEPLEYVAIGTDGRGRLLELVAVDAGDAWIIKHAQTPPQEGIKHELGLGR